MRPVFACTLLVALFGSGCAHKAMITTWEPAGIAVGELHQIAVLPFQGEQGDAVSARLSEELATGEFYSLIDPAKLSQEVQPASFSQSPVTPFKEMLCAAEIRGVDGILCGEIVEYRCQDHELSRFEWPLRFDSRDSGSASTSSKSRLQLFSPRRVREAEVTMTFRLIEVASGDVLVERTIRRHIRQELESEAAAEVSVEESLAPLVEECLAEIVSLLAPHETSDEIELARGEGSWLSRKQVRQGVALAESGDWEAAEEQWVSALRYNPRNHAAVYNMAVSAARHQDFTRAEEFAMKALRIQHRDIYARGLETIRALRTALNRTLDQQDARVARTDDGGESL